MSRRSEFTKTIEREVQDWPGASIAFGRGAKHHFAVIQFGDQERTTWFPGTPSETRGVLNKVAEIRRLLRALGARRRSHGGDSPERKAA